MSLQSLAIDPHTPTAGSGWHARQLCRRAAVVLLLLGAGCGGSSPSAPQAPSTVPTVASVTVAAVAVGSQFQCTAVAGFSDGSTQNVTSQAAWNSSASQVATVTGAGLVTPVSTGSTDITATYGAATGTLRLAVVISSPSPSPTPTYTLSGAVRDASSGASLPGAQAEVIDGVDAGRTAAADGAGRYVLAGLSAGQFRVYFRHAGYDTLAATVTLAADQTLDVVLTQGAPPAPAPPAPTTYTLTGVIRATPLNEVLVDAHVEAMHGGSPTVSVTTDGTGTYRLPGLERQQYVLRMTKAGYNAANRDFTVTGDATLDLVMDRNRVTIEGFVDEAQPCFGPILETRVEVVSGPDAGKFSLNDRTGFSYQVAGVAWGTFTLRASKATYTAVDVPLTVPPPLAFSGTIVTQHFRLPNPTGRYVVSGTISDTMVETAPWINGALVEIFDGPNAGKTATSGTAGLGNGVYRFADLLGVRSAWIPGVEDRLRVRDGRQQRAVRRCHQKREADADHRNVDGDRARRSLRAAGRSSGRDRLRNAGRQVRDHRRRRPVLDHRHLRGIHRAGVQDRLRDRAAHDHHGPVHGLELRT